MTARVAKAGAAYFALVFAAAFCLGVVRVPLVVPWVGETGAVLLEAPPLVAVIVLAARWSVNRFEVQPGPSRLGVGVVALVLQQTGEFWSRRV